MDSYIDWDERSIVRYRVYRVKRDRRFAYFYPTPEGPRGPFNGYIYMGNRIGNTWVPPDVYRLYPLRDQWDVAPYLNTSALVITQRAAELLDGFVRNAGVELLPFEAEGQTFYVVNVLEVPNCLDHTRSEMPPDRGIVIQYAFHPRRITRSLFKLPEALGDVFVAEDDTRQDWSFKAACERLGLAGLRYELLWQSESGPGELKGT